MLGLQDLRNILSSEVSHDFMKSIEDAEGLELGVIAYSVIDQKYSLDDLSLNIVNKLKSIDLELIIRAKKEPIEEFEACVKFGGECVSDYLARLNNIQIQEGFPFSMKPLDGVNYHEEWDLSLRLLEELRELGISLQNGYIINIMRDTGLCRIHNPRNHKLLTWITSKDRSGYRIQGEEIVIDKSKSLAEPLITRILNGECYEEVTVKHSDYELQNVISYSLLKHPQYLYDPIANSPNVNCARDLAKLVYQGIIPNDPPEREADVIPLDFLPIPPKEIVINLDERWSYFISAWNILGDYGIENLKYTHAHLEMAYRNGLYNPEMKINSYHKINSKSPLQEKFMFDIPIIEHVFQLRYKSNCDHDVNVLGDRILDVDGEDINPGKVSSFFLWVNRLGIYCEDMRYDLLQPEIQIMPIRPWHHIATSKQEMIKEAEWINTEMDYQSK